MSDNVNRPFQAQAQLSSVSKESGIDIPVERVSLPSKWLIYSQGHPLFNEEFVEIKCMSAKEEDLLTSSALIKNGTVLTKLIESCLLNKSINAEDLILGDRNALLIGIRVTGYGSTYSVKIKCDDCNEEYDADFTLNGLTIKSLSSTPIQPNMNLFSYKLPVSGLDVQFKLLTGQDENEITQIKERNKKLGSQVEKNVTLKLFQSVASINGETDRSKLNYTINNLRAGDARALRNHIKEISPDIDMHQWTKCKKCNAESEVEIPLSVGFLWPDFDK